MPMKRQIVENKEGVFYQAQAQLHDLVEEVLSKTTSVIKVA
jgi:hypothetical protein